MLCSRLSELPLVNREQREETLIWSVPEVNQNVFSIEPESDGYRVRGKKIERLIAMSNFQQPETVMRIQRVLDATGINAALMRAGVEEGNSIYIGGVSLTWTDEMEP